jgi:hypothetical protein
MPKRVIDFDALWASDKIAACPAWAQAEYAWLYGLADASGSFELTNLRVIWGRVAAVRKDLTLERLEQIFQEFTARGLLFTWEAGGKRYGHWTGSDVPGRLPPPSWRARLERLAPPLPRVELAAYMSRFASRQSEWRVPEFGEGVTASAKCEQQYDGRENCRDGAASAEMNPAPEVRHCGSATADVQPGTATAISTTQLKLGLETPQAQEWDRDWKEEKERTVTPRCVPGNRPSEDAAAQQQPRRSAEELLEIYERERGSLPAAVMLTPERRRQCALRIRAGLASEEFGAAVRRAAATPFLAGQGARGWRASFDWLIANDTNVRKVIEGVYEPAEARASPQAGFAARASDRMLYSELHVGTGPIAADYGARVKPEVLERLRARQRDGGHRSGPGRGG